MINLRERLASLTLLPVLTVHSEEQAVGLCRALSAGGITAVEITLRTPAALAAIAAVRQSLPELQVAAGTVLGVKDVEAVAAAGVDFAVSPGLSRQLVDAARSLSLALLPGVSTASEVMTGLECGLDCFKFFPASACGGPALLKAFVAPFHAVSFCPTGGINASNVHAYLSLPNVLCVGGSWMIDQEHLANHDWTAITAATQQALASIEAKGS
ncbi:MAG: bifunctional 4-hydroxy-2-oxoglutarate aldolase/2-dehydro-3-deoxy-phosphogluconate aldolase [Pseudomonadales bacterium]|nr:bifunctional 4-hydroxy-2-oxoglutarate aldolase/2-dehydro-3-deoxy-phosphogluconate aldolase [Pseudomonadales bacterium]